MISKNPRNLFVPVCRMFVVFWVQGFLNNASRICIFVYFSLIKIGTGL